MLHYYKCFKLFSLVKYKVKHEVKYKDEYVKITTDCH